MRQVFFPTLHSEYIYLLRGNQYYYQNLALIFVHNHILHCGRRRMLFLSSPLHSLVSKQYFVRFNSGGIGDDSNRALPLQTYVIQLFFLLAVEPDAKNAVEFRIHFGGQVGGRLRNALVRFLLFVRKTHWTLLSLCAQPAIFIWNAPFNWERAKKRMHSSRGMGFSLNHKNRLNYRRLYLTSFATQEQNQKLTKNKKKKKKKKEQIMMHFFGAAIQSVPREPSSECRWWCCCSVRDERIQLKRKFLLQIARFCFPHYKESHRMKNSCKTWFAYTTRHFFLSFTLNDANMILHTLDANWFHKKKLLFVDFVMDVSMDSVWFGSVALEDVSVLFSVLSLCLTILPILSPLSPFGVM